MAFYLQGIQFYKSEYIMPQHLGRLASLSSSPNLLYPKIDSDDGACEEQEAISGKYIIALFLLSLCFVTCEKI
jgi:hypothetical protein